MMNMNDAVRLEMHIRNCAPKYNPEAKQIGNGEWVVYLNNKEIVWSIDDWNNNFVPRSQPAKQEEQEVSV